MRYRSYLDEGISLPGNLKTVWDKVKKELAGLSFEGVKKKAEDAWNELRIKIEEEKWDSQIRTIIDNGKLDDIDRKIIEELIKGRDEVVAAKRKKLFGESIELNEDAKHWWNLIKSEAFPTLAFYPALQVWLELDKYIKGADFSDKVMFFYAALWVALVSGKYIAQWRKWKKENPDEYKKERELGAGGII